MRPNEEICPGVQLHVTWLRFCFHLRRGKPAAAFVARKEHLADLLPSCKAGPPDFEKLGAAEQLQVMPMMNQIEVHPYLVECLSSLSGLPDAACQQASR